jgi:hypothetical protein
MLLARNAAEGESARSGDGLKGLNSFRMKASRPIRLCFCQGTGLSECFVCGRIAAITSGIETACNRFLRSFFSIFLPRYRQQLPRHRHSFSARSNASQSGQGIAHLLPLCKPRRPQNARPARMLLPHRAHPSQ